MGQMLRILLIWLVTLAVPAQGMAAAVRLHCGPGHHGTQTTQRMPQVLPGAPPSVGQHAHHRHSSHAAPDANAVSDNGQNAVAPDASGAGQTGAAADPAKGTKSTYQKCSACASCCAGLALPSAAVLPPPMDPAREVTVLSAPMAASVFVEGPERPPRILRA